MFDIGFMELVLIAIVSLLVIGPERLPGAIRTASLWVGRAKRSFNQVKTEIEREINADEIRRQLHNESILADLDKAKKKADSFVKDAQKNIDNLNSEVNATLKMEDTAKSPAEPRQPPSIMPPASETVPEQSSQPTAEEADPARFDEEQEEAVPAVEPEQAPAAKPEPVVDFYNNPPAGTIQLKNGVFSSVPDKSGAEEGQQGKK